MDKLLVRFSGAANRHRAFLFFNHGNPVEIEENGGASFRVMQYVDAAPKAPLNPPTIA